MSLDAAHQMHLDPFVLLTNSAIPRRRGRFINLSQAVIVLRSKIAFLDERWATVLDDAEQIAPQDGDAWSLCSSRVVPITRRDCLIDRQRLCFHLGNEPLNPAAGAPLMPFHPVRSHGGDAPRRVSRIPV